MKNTTRLFLSLMLTLFALRSYSQLTPYLSLEGGASISTFSHQYNGDQPYKTISMGMIEKSFGFVTGIEINKTKSIEMGFYKANYIGPPFNIIGTKQIAIRGCYKLPLLKDKIYLNTAIGGRISTYKTSASRSSSSGSINGIEQVRNKVILFVGNSSDYTNTDPFNEDLQDISSERKFLPLLESRIGLGFEISDLLSLGIDLTYCKGFDKEFIVNHFKREDLVNNQTKAGTYISRGDLLSLTIGIECNLSK